MTPVLPDSPSALAHLVVWRLPDVGITLVDFLGGIGIGLAAVLKVAFTVRQYIYMGNNQVSIRVVRHHFHELMVFSPQQLHPSVICGCFACFPRDVTLVSEADLRHLGLVDMVIAG
jgi:hypothetical protein